MFRKLIIATTFLITFGSVNAAFGATSLVFTAGQLGGGWYGDAVGISKIIHDAYPDINIKVQPGGGTSNPIKVSKGTAQLGMALDVFLAAAKNGTEPYSEPMTNLRSLGKSFADIYMHLVARKDAPYHDMDTLFKDGKNVTIAVTKPGSSDEQAFRFVMQYYGVDYKKLRQRGWQINFLNYSNSANQFSNGQVEYAFHALGLPSSAVQEMAIGTPAELMEWPKDLVQYMVSKHGFTKAMIPKTTYPRIQDHDIRTIDEKTVIVVNSKMAEKTSYNIIKAICEHQDDLGSIDHAMKVFDCKTAGDDARIPLAPGAKRYYKEQGYEY